MRPDDDTDITGLKQALASLRESQKRFLLLADTAPVMIWMSGSDKLCTYFNQRWLDFTGRPIEGELGNGWSEGVHPEDLERCLDTYTTAFDRRELFQMEYRLRRHDGQYRWIADSGAPTFNADGSFAGYIGSAIDVTESKLAREALQKSDDRFRLAAKTGKMFAYEWDVASDVITRSGEWADILGIDEATAFFTGQQAISKVQPDDREKVKAAIARLSPEKPYLKITYRMVRPDGAVIWVERNSRAYFNEQGTMLRVVGMVADITERKRAEEAIANVNQKLIEAHEEERTRIARELHDDISQRLALLIMKLDRLRTADQTPPAEFRDGIVEAGEDLSNLAHDIQALSHRLHSSKLEYFGLAKAAASYCRELSEQHEVVIGFHSEDIPDDLSKEIGLCMFRVLQESLQNAIKHSCSRRFEVSFTRTQIEMICLIVHDSGVGFDPVEALKGRGLGLISMKERINLVGGELSIESQPGKGTTIRASVPPTPTARSARAG
jgi:PAS domain S-box-containing protein